jgi:hypothetical protein
MLLVSTTSSFRLMVSEFLTVVDVLCIVFIRIIMLLDDGPSVAPAAVRRE